MIRFARTTLFAVLLAAIPAHAASLPAIDLRFAGHPHPWFSNAANATGGVAGGPGGDTCNDTLRATLCNIAVFVLAVNATALCSYGDWRMPTKLKLLTLVKVEGNQPYVDQACFLNTVGSYFWTGSSYAPNPASVWFVDFFHGYANALLKTGNYLLVR